MTVIHSFLVILKEYLSIILMEYVTNVIFYLCQFDLRNIPRIAWGKRVPDLSWCHWWKYS